ncbi:MAG TPA: apolipoprotein N-acyltransferase [Acidimicrobiia bacterium]
MLPRPASHPAGRRGQDGLSRLRLKSRRTIARPVRIAPLVSSSAPPATADLDEPDAPREPAPSTSPRTRARVGAAVAAGLLLAAARPPFDIGPLALVALVPLWWAWRGATPRQGALTGLAGGVAYYGVLVYWVWYFGAVAIVPLVLILAASWAATGALVAWFSGCGRSGAPLGAAPSSGSGGSQRRRGVRGPWILAASWVVLEAVIARFPVGGFSWGEVGYALHGIAFGRALASWGGVPLVSFVVVAASALLVDVAAGARRRSRRDVGMAVLGLVALVAAVAVADVARFTPKSTGTLRYALIQGNDKNRELTQAEVDDEYLTNSHLRLAARLHGHYDLIVFPESSLDSDPKEDPALRTRLVAVARAHGADVLANAITTDARGRSFNTNLLYEPGGRLQGEYSKQHLVPFGEYIPMQSIFGHIGATKQIKTLFNAGHGDRIFHVANRPIGSVICFETAFAPIVRSYVRDGAQAIVVTTNNRSYRRSANSAQHLDTSQMRAAETARPVLHASISGITAVFDASGHQLRRTHLFRNTVVTGAVTTTTGETPYVRYGDWVVWGSAIAVAAATIVVIVRRRRDGSNRDSSGSLDSGRTGAPAEPPATLGGRGD